MKRLLLLLALASATAFAAEPILIVPQFAKRQGEPAEGDPLQAKYDAAWAKYAEAVAKATAAVNKALDAQFAKAADAGNLELADMWDKKKKVFLDMHTIEWPTDGKAKAEWRKTNPTVEFPEDFSEAVASAQQAYIAAIDALKGDYEELVKGYTKARNLDRAKQVREEMAALDKKPVAPPQRPGMVEGKPAPVKPAEKPLLDRIAGKWSTPEEALVRVIHADGRCFEIRKSDGGVHSKGKVTVSQDGVGVVQLENGFKLEFRPLKPDGDVLELQVFGHGAVKPFAVISLHRMP